MRQSYARRKECLGEEQDMGVGRISTEKNLVGCKWVYNVKHNSKVK
jgi:hypothetical protein